MSTFAIHHCDTTAVTPLKSGTDDIPLSSTPVHERLDLPCTRESAENTYMEIDIQTSPVLLDNSTLYGNTSTTLDETL